jgi:hypothetical protein
MSAGILPDVIGSLFGLGADPAHQPSPSTIKSQTRAPQGLVPQKRVDDGREPPALMQAPSVMPPDVPFLPPDYGLHQEFPLEMNPPSVNGEQPLYNL